MANVLDKIVADKRIELTKRKAERPLESFKNQVRPSTKDFYGALKNGPTSFILECKKASPSKGLIREVFDLDEITSVYKKYASAMSVLTDEKYFQGSFDYLTTVREKVEQPLICKDFFIDPYQVYLARLHGGDAILLMLSVLDDNEYRTLHDIADSLHMDVLTEVSNEEEVQRALDLDAKIIGINNRNLRDLSTDLATTERLRALIPADKVVISESGIYTHADVKRLSPLCNGFLVGSSLMAQKDLDAACRAMIYGEHKVCGLTRVKDAAAVLSAGALFGGLIFYPGSARYVDFDCAKAITSEVPLRYVGVFVNAPLEQVSEYAKQLKLSAVQLHGDEDAQYIQKLRAQLPVQCQIWKAQAVDTVLPEPISGVDRVLFDTYAKHAKGGTGKAFNWDLLNNAQTPFMLAGGLNPENVTDALNKHAQGLDFNSGLESQPGRKNEKKIEAAFAAIRNY